MKRFLTITMIILSFFILSGSSGCRGPQYEEDEKTAMEQSGKELMQAWLDDHLPESEVLSAEAYIDMVPSGPHYLTDSVYGTISRAGSEQGYEIDVNTKEVYLETDISLLEDEARPYVLETLGLSDHAADCTFSDFSAYIPKGMSSASEYSENTGFLPGDLVLKLENTGENDAEALSIIDDFLRAPDSRPEITVSGTILVPEDIDLKSYNMSFFENARKNSGLYFSFFYMNQEHDHVSAIGWYTTYERYVRKPLEDFFVEYREESVSDKVVNGKIEPMEHYTNDVSNLQMYETDSGYGFSFKDPDNWFMFTILANENSKLMPFNYTDRYDQAANLGTGSYGGNRYIDHKVHWEQRPDGYWTLKTEDGAAAHFSNADELIPIYPER